MCRYVFCLFQSGREKKLFALYFMTKFEQEPARGSDWKLFSSIPFPFPYMLFSKECKDIQESFWLHHILSV